MKLAKTQISENVFVYDTETFPDEENGDCGPSAGKFFPVSKIANSMAPRDLRSEEIEKKETEAFAEGVECCIDNKMKHLGKKSKGDPKNTESELIVDMILN